LAVCGGARHAEGLGNVVERQLGKDVQLDDLRRGRVFGGQFGQRSVQFHQAILGLVDGGRWITEFHPLAVAAALFPALSPGVFDQDASHRLGRRRVEMTATVPLRFVVRPDQPQVGIRDLNGAMPTELVEVIDRLMAKKPDERFATAREVCDVLAAQLAILQRPTNPGTPLANPVAPPTSAEHSSPERPPSRSRRVLPRDTGGLDRTIRLWNCRTFECERIFEQRRANEGLAFSPDGRWLAAAGRDGTVSVHDVATGAEVVTSPRLADCLIGVAFSPDQRLLLTSASDTFVRLHDVETARETQRLIGHSRSGNQVAFHPSGRSAISTSHDGTARQWNLQTGQTHRLLSVRGRLFHGVRFSPDLRCAALGGTNGSLVIWDLAAEPPTARLLALFPSARADQWLHCAAFSPDGRQLATANPDGTIYLLKLNPPAAARDAGE